MEEVVVVDTTTSTTTTAATKTCVETDDLHSGSGVLVSLHTWLWGLGCHEQMTILEYPNARLTLGER